MKQTVTSWGHRHGVGESVGKAVLEALRAGLMPRLSGEQMEKANAECRDHLQRSWEGYRMFVDDLLELRSPGVLPATEPYGSLVSFIEEFMDTFIGGVIEALEGGAGKPHNAVLNIWRLAEERGWLKKPPSSPEVNPS